METQRPKEGRTVMKVRSLTAANRSAGWLAAVTGGGGGCAVTPGETSGTSSFVWMLLPLGLLVRRRALGSGGSRFPAQGYGSADEVSNIGLAAGNVPLRCFGRVTVPVAEIVIAEDSPSALDEAQVGAAIS